MSNIVTREGRRLDLRLSAAKRPGIYALTKDIYLQLPFKIFMQNEVKAYRVRVSRQAFWSDQNMACSIKSTFGFTYYKQAVKSNLNAIDI